MAVVWSTNPAKKVVGETGRICASVVKPPWVCALGASQLGTIDSINNIKGDLRASRAEVGPSGGFQHRKKPKRTSSYPSGARP